MNETQRLRHSRENALRLTEQAASWYLDQRAGLSESQQGEFLAWLRRSPAHLSEYLAIAQLHGDMQVAATLEALSTEQLVDLAATESAVVALRKPDLLPSHKERPRVVAPRRRVRTAWLAAAAMLAIAALGASAWRLSREAPGDVYSAGNDAVRGITLPDGTLVQLDRGSSIAVHFDRHARRIDVLSGNALFDVAKDPERPLSVAVGANLLRDIGTVFAVQRNADEADVAVISGRVQVLERDSRWLPWRTAANAPLADLHGGEQAHMDESGGVRRTASVDLASATAWLPAEIRFQRDTVADVARRFNAYTTRPLVIEDGALAKMRLSGVFHARDVDAFIAYLQTLPHVRIVRENDRVRVLAANSSQSAARL
jgi:transmembrane sensor